MRMIDLDENRAMIIAINGGENYYGIIINVNCFIRRHR